MGQVTSSCMSTSTVEVSTAILLAPARPGLASRVPTGSWVDEQTKQHQSKKMREKKRDADYPGVRGQTLGVTRASHSKQLQTHSLPQLVLDMNLQPH